MSLADDHRDPDEDGKGAAEAPSRALVVGVVALFVVMIARARQLAFLQDDAYISFRYARNFAENGEITYNAGEFLEGYSNFSWVVLLAMAAKLGVEPPDAAQVLGPLSFVAVIPFAVGYLRELQGRVGDFHVLPMLALFLIPLNHSASAYATGGMATSLFATLMAATFWAAIARPAWLGPLALAAVLTRPEGLAVAAFGVLAYLADRRLGPKPAPWRRSLLVLPVGVAIYGAWKLWYFGDLLPNTFYAKSGFETHTAYGWKYTVAYVGTYPYVWLFWLLPVLAWLSRRQASLAVPLSLPAGAHLFFTAYIITVGGDHMEYKPFVHAFATGVIGLGAAMVVLSPRSRPLTLGLLLSLPLMAGPGRPRSYPEHTFGVAVLQGQIEGPRGWIAAGRLLKEKLPPDVTLSVNAAGAIPYESELRTIDRLGLVDAGVAHQSKRNRKSAPGHQKVAATPYLRSRGAQLLLTYPMWHKKPKQHPAKNHVFIQSESGRWLRLEYIKPSRALTAHLRAEGGIRLVWSLRASKAAAEKRRREAAEGR